VHIHSAKRLLPDAAHQQSFSSRLAVGETACRNILDGDISSAFHTWLAQLLVKVFSIAYNMFIVLFLGCGAVARLPHSHLTTLLPILEQSQRINIR
jgi:hypothetical protein